MFNHVLKNAAAVRIYAIHVLECVLALVQLNVRMDVPLVQIIVHSGVILHVIRHVLHHVTKCVSIHAQKVVQQELDQMQRLLVLHKIQQQEVMNHLPIEKKNNVHSY